MSISTLNDDLNILQNLAIPGFEEDVDVIQKLDDEPNDVGGLTAAELKAKFDEAGNRIKTYLNETLVPSISETVAEAEERAEAEAARVLAEEQRVTAEQERVAAEAEREQAEAERRAGEAERAAAEAERKTAEDARVLAEQNRVDTDSGIVAQATSAAEAAENAASRAASAAIHQPIIGDNGNWFTWSFDAGAYVDTGIYAGGDAPYIGENGNWYVGQMDTGVSATSTGVFVGSGEMPEGYHLQIDPNGEETDFIPYIGTNGNWFVGNTDLNVPATGPIGPIGVTGATGPEGPAGSDGKSAYQYAVEGGYTGTEEAFTAKMAAEIPTVDDTLTQVGQAADAAAVGDRFSQLSEEKVDKAGWTPDKYIGTDAGGNLIEKEAPNDGDSTENDVYAGRGYSNTKVTFDRLPINFSTPLKYQGWVGNSIVRYKNNYAELVYLRDGHSGSTKNTVCVFFDGYDIDRVEQCYFDGEAGYENNIGSICVYEMDGIYYTPKYDTTTMYQSTDLINWTTSPNVVSPTITPWGIWNIDGVLYAGDDATRNTIYVSSDGGKNWQTITIASSYELSEAAFTSVGDKILCFFGKNWTTSTQTSESGHAEMLVYDGTTWSEPKTTNIICNYGNAAGWFDGKLVHVVAKSRRYHLNNGNNGDGSQLQHYCATPEKALQGEFEFIQRIDRNRGDEEGAIAIDSASVSICINDDGTGLLVSPVSAQRDIMQHSFYSINALMQTNIANKHENEIANYKNKYLLNGIISSGGAKVKHVLQIANGKLDTYGVAGTDYAQSANITLATDGTYIDASSAYSTVGSVGDGMVCIKPLYDVLAPVLIGYKDGNNGYVWARTAGWGVAVLGVWTSISRSTVHNALYCVVNDGVPLFYFDSIYGLIKCVPYTWKSVSIANAKGTSSPCVSAQANNLQFTNLEYYGI